MTTRRGCISRKGEAVALVTSCGSGPHRTAPERSRPVVSNSFRNDLEPPSQPPGQFDPLPQPGERFEPSRSPAAASVRSRSAWARAQPRRRDQALRPGVMRQVDPDGCGLVTSPLPVARQRSPVLCGNRMGLLAKGVDGSREGRRTPSNASLAGCHSRRGPSVSFETHAGVADRTLHGAQSSASAAAPRAGGAALARTPRCPHSGGRTAVRPCRCILEARHDVLHSAEVAS
jgi:hypothetical protein